MKLRSVRFVHPMQFRGPEVISAVEAKEGMVDLAASSHPKLGPGVLIRYAQGVRAGEYFVPVHNVAWVPPEVMEAKDASKQK